MSAGETKSISANLLAHPPSGPTTLEFLEQLENELYRIETRTDGGKRYKIQKYLGGCSGKSCVVLANDSRYGKIAIKFVPTCDETLRRRFTREVRMLARVAHPNIVAAKSDKALSSQDTTLMAALLEYVPGRTINHAITNDETTLKEVDVVQMAIDVLHGLEYCHKLKVIHKDVKCANILCGPKGYKLTDFGFAVMEKSAVNVSDSMRSQSFGVNGTMHYMSPEQFDDGALDENDDDNDDEDDEEEEEEEEEEEVFVLDHRTDIWSLGVVMFRCLCGKLPFGRKKTNHYKVRDAVRNSKGPRFPSSLTSGSDELRRVIVKALQNHPDNRYQTAREMLGALQPLVVVDPLARTRVSVEGALNSPGYWDIFISHTQRNAEGKVLALDFHVTLKDKKKSSWLDVKMAKISMAAMEEGAKNSKCVVALITDACVNNDCSACVNGNCPENKPGKDHAPENNAMLNRWMCQQELRWAVENDVPIQPVVRAEDKKKIGNFIQMLPADLKILGGVDWKHLDRGNKRYFDLGVDMILEGAEELAQQMKEPRMQKLYAESRAKLAEMKELERSEKQQQQQNSGETKSSADVHDLFLSHKQNDINPELKIRMKDLARTLNEHFKGRKIKCFLDKNFNGNSWNELPNLVASSKMILVLLSEKFVESPWCVLELLSAVMHKRPIAFLKISNSFKFATMKKQLVQIGFPFVEALDQFSVEIEYSETYFDAAMDKVAERMRANAVTHPLLMRGGDNRSVTFTITPEKVAEQYEILRDARNEQFPGKRSWPSWGVNDADVSSARAVVTHNTQQQQQQTQGGNVYVSMSLYNASEKGSMSEVNDALNSDGVDVNEKGPEGQTPLWIAFARDHFEIAKKLLKRTDLCVNQANDLGMTALCMATKNRNVEIVRLLLSNSGIDIEKTFQGQTPLAIAKQKGHTEIVKLLEDHNDAREINALEEVTRDRSADEQSETKKGLPSSVRIS